VVDFKNKGVDRDINHAKHKYLEFDIPVGYANLEHRSRDFFIQQEAFVKYFFSCLWLTFKTN
jgi:hypothetical protein